MEAAFYFGLGCGRPNGNRIARPIFGSMLPGSSQAASHRRGVGGEKWIALSIVNLTRRADGRLRPFPIGMIWD